MNRFSALVVAIACEVLYNLSLCNLLRSRKTFVSLLDDFVG